MHLHDLMGWTGPMTHRQYVAWQKWLSSQWNEPSRTDHYLMQVAAESFRPHARHPEAVKMDSYRLKFYTTREAKPSATSVIEERKARAERSRATWDMIMTAIKGRKASGRKPPINPATWQGKPKGK